jgi:hypothetical protein
MLILADVAYNSGRSEGESLMLSAKKSENDS